MPKTMKITQFGNPILRQTAERIRPADITNSEIQELIDGMKHTLVNKKLGVGLAAPQVGVSKALVVIAVRQLIHRQNVEPFDLVLINPEITETSGRKTQLYEGCISGGPGKAGIFAKVPRYKKVQVKYYDEQGKHHHETYEGLHAQIIQHEVDHLNGVLFVDKVKDTRSYMSYAEYIKRARKVLAKKAQQPKS